MNNSKNSPGDFHETEGWLCSFDSEKLHPSSTIIKSHFQTHQQNQLDNSMIKKAKEEKPFVSKTSTSSAFSGSDVNEIYWRRKWPSPASTSRTTSRGKTHGNPSSVVPLSPPPPPPPMTPSSCCSSGTSKISRRKRSTSRSRQRQSSIISAGSRKEMKDTFHNSDSSLRVFVNPNEIIWHRKGGRSQTGAFSSPPHPHNTVAGSSSKDDDNSNSSSSLNSTEGDSFVSTTSSFSSEVKPPRPRNRMGAAARAAELRKQIRDQHRAELQKTEAPNRHSSAPRILSVPEPSPRQQQRKRAMSQVLPSTPKTKGRTSLQSVSLTESSMEPPKKSLSLTKGKSTRTVVRNKRKLERELLQSDIFRFVLHKCAADNQEQTTAGSSGNRTPISNTSTTTSPHAKREQRKSQTTQHKKMPLEQFLMMKRQSEELLQMQQQQQQKSTTVVQDEFTKSNQTLEDYMAQQERVVSPKPRQSHPFIMINPGLKKTIFQLQQGDSIIENEENFRGHTIEANDEDVDVNSFITFDWKDISSAWPDEMKEVTNTLSMVEGVESQPLSLSVEDNMMMLDDLEGDNASLQNSVEGVNEPKTPTEKQVKRFIMIDPSGRRSVYSGTISTSSGMPNGEGRLEYPDRGEIFIGRFVHGFWSGYGTCLCTLTKEEYTGFFLDYVKHGHGVTKYVDGRRFEGTYNKGVKVEGKMTYQDGSTYVGKFEGGVRSGRGTYMFPSGSAFFGKFEDDELHKGVLTYPNGGRFVGQWKNGARHGPGKEFRPDGSINRKGHWHEGRFVS